MVLATGTAIFRPGIQGTLVRTTTRYNSSVAWGIFQQGLPRYDRLAVPGGAACPQPVAGLYSSDPAQMVKGIPQGEAFDWLVAFTGQPPRALSDLMYRMHDVGMVWYFFGAIGIVSAIGIWQYGRWIRTLRHE